MRVTVVGIGLRAVVASILVFGSVAVIALAIMAGTAAAASFSDRFPETGAFNNMAIEYKVTGFSVDPAVDSNGFVTSRYCSGKITSRTIRISGVVYGEDKPVPPGDGSTWEYKCRFVGQPQSYHDLLMSGPVPKYDNWGGFTLYDDSNYPIKVYKEDGLQGVSEIFDWTFDVPSTYPYMIIYMTVGIHPSSADDRGLLVGFMLENPYYTGGSSGSSTDAQPSDSQTDDYDSSIPLGDSSSDDGGGSSCCCCFAVVLPLLIVGTVFVHGRRKQ